MGGGVATPGLLSSGGPHNFGKVFFFRLKSVNVNINVLLVNERSCKHVSGQCFFMYTTGHLVQFGRLVFPHIDVNQA